MSPSHQQMAINRSAGAHSPTVSSTAYSIKALITGSFIFMAHPPTRHRSIQLIQRRFHSTVDVRLPDSNRRQYTVRITTKLAIDFTFMQMTLP